MPHAYVKDSNVIIVNGLTVDGMIASKECLLVVLFHLEGDFQVEHHRNLSWVLFTFFIIVLDERVGEQ